MTRSLQAIRCLCGSEPVCPFHAPRITGESRIDRIYREARETVRERDPHGLYYEYGTTTHARRRRFDLAVIREVDRRLAEAGIPIEVGMATPESIALQRASLRRPRINTGDDE